MAPVAWFDAYALRPQLVLRGIRAIFRNPPNHLESWFFLFWAIIFSPLLVRAIRENRVQHLHAAWATAPASVAWLAHKLCGVPFSFGAQAYDLYRRGGDNFLAAKARNALFVHTTTENNVKTLQERVPGMGDKILLARRGLEALPPSRGHRRDENTIRLLSVGRLVPKKGHVYQLQACRELKIRKRFFELKIVGEGYLRAELQEMARQWGIADQVEFCGAASPEEVTQYYAWADIFWHTGVVDPKGDRDGLPNVVPEAMAHEVPVICGVEVGVLEAIRDRETGLVVPPENTAQLADAILEIKDNPDLRRELTTRARQWVSDHFLAEKNAARIAKAIRSGL